MVRCRCPAGVESWLPLVLLLRLGIINEEVWFVLELFIEKPRVIWVACIIVLWREPLLQSQLKCFLLMCHILVSIKRVVLHMNMLFLWLAAWDVFVVHDGVLEVILLQTTLANKPKTLTNIPWKWSFYRPSSSDIINLKAVADEFGLTLLDQFVLPDQMPRHHHQVWVSSITFGSILFVNNFF